MPDGTSSHKRVLPGDVSSRVDRAAGRFTKCGWKGKKERRAKEYNSRKDLSCYLQCPFAGAMEMDLTEVFDFWRELKTQELFLALWAILMVLSEIIDEWQKFFIRKQNTSWTTQK